MKRINWKIRAPPTVVIAGAAILAVVVGLADFCSGYKASFFVFYFMPVAGTAWLVGRKTSFVMAAFCASIWFLADWQSGHEYPSLWLPFWNAGMRLTAFIIIGYMTSRIRRLVMAQAKEISELSKLIPICANCKRIRDDAGYWHQVEVYLNEHKQLQFSHDICEKCAQILYPGNDIKVHKSTR